jgi:NADPH:quinone reductase-like Zn-dependent oxidoreductase
VLALPVDGKVINVDMEDWMFLIDDKVMLNRTAMSKFGVNLGSVTLSFTKRAAMNPRIGLVKGKRVWMIGASTGIGEACAHLLADLGARVAFSARGWTS